MLLATVHLSWMNLLLNDNDRFRIIFPYPAPFTFVKKAVSREFRPFYGQNL